MRYEIKGGMMPVVEIVLEAGESVNCEKGAWYGCLRICRCRHQVAE